MGEWRFEGAIFTRARRRDAWAFWTDMRNHARLEPGVERIELDGPFVTGTTGRTVTAGSTHEWMLEDVVPGRRFVITGLTPDGLGGLSFTWEFADEGSGTRMTQHIRAYGPEVERHLDEFRGMERSAPAAMAQLAAELDRLAEGTGPE